MNWTYQQRVLPAVAAAIAVALASSTAYSETRNQTTPQPYAQNAGQFPMQTAAQASAGAPPGSAAAPQAKAVRVEAKAPISPEEQGDLLMTQQRYQAAIEAYRKASRSAEVWNKTGIAYQLMFNLTEAARCYRQSLRMNGKNPNVINNLGTIYDAQKEYGDAERYYHKALKQNSKSALIYKNLGTNLLAQHKYKKGWEAYKTALELNPGIFKDSSSPRVQNATSLEERGAMNFYMAKGCVRAGMNDCAIEYLRAALNEGFTSPKKIEADGEFAGLRGVPAFQQLLAEQRQQ
ncbi:MAG TPA: tetratricopeptide repeat protein [Terracidiphilus sp.]|jgi:tetratricopeptide (TPR) repeat protein